MKKGVEKIMIEIESNIRNGIFMIDKNIIGITEKDIKKFKKTKTDFIKLKIWL